MNRIHIIIGLLITLISYVIVLNWDGHKYNKAEEVMVGEIIGVYIDKEFNRGEVKEIKRAIGEWNRAMNGNIKMEVVDEKFDMEVWKIKKIYIGGGLGIIKIEESKFEAMSTKGWQREVLGYTDAIGGNLIYIIGDRVHGKYYGVVLHEIGHIMGAEHTEGGLMYKEYGGYDCVDKEAAEEVSKYKGYGIETIRYCY